jgi:hypothetical protein
MNSPRSAAVRHLPGLIVSTALVAVLVTSAAACRKVQAKTPAAPPPVVALDIPTPPARVTIPVELPDVEPPPNAQPPAASPSRPRADNSAAPRPAPPPAPAPAPTEGPAPVLQTTTDTGGQERKTQSLIDEAAHKLENVKYRDISPQAKAQYDSAVSFIKNARVALRNKNYMYAEQLAMKAAAVARELVKG